MRPLVKFAGHDPFEDDFEGVEPAPLHDDERRPGNTSINIARAWELKHAGMSWNQIGCILAREIGRPIAFHGQSVSFAAMRYQQKRGA